MVPTRTSPSMQIHPPPDPDASPTAPPPTAGARPDRRRGPRALLFAAIALATCLLLLVGFAAWEVRRFGQIPRVEVPSVDAAGDGQVANWLLVGTDGREGIDPSDPNAGAFLGEVVTGTRTDTILVARADAGAGTVDLLSVPRDLWVPIAGDGQLGRINGAFNGEGGPERLTATVEAALGIDINHYIEIDFTGFRDVVDAIGGVTVDVANPARDLQSGLAIDGTGPQVLDGDQALALARSRAYEEFVDGSWRMDPTGDIGRTERQRLLLARIVDAAGRSFGPTGLLTVDRVLAAGASSLVIDDGTDLFELLSLARTTAGVGAEAVASHALPVDDHRTSGGAQVLRLREAEADAVLGRFRAPAA